jgi:hypothetical protein
VVPAAEADTAVETLEAGGVDAYLLGEVARGEGVTLS